jgi:hypothetical protein
VGLSIDIPKELPLIREEHGFRRTECACPFCQAPCRHIPGGLDPADLPRLGPQGQDLFTWAEQHLRALTDRPFPTLVPARGPDGSCHWFFTGCCAVHAAAPYGCAFFDSHMRPQEIERRYAATIQARQADQAANGLYYRVWLHVCHKGLIATAGSREALTADWLRIHRIAQRSRQRASRSTQSS